MIDRRFDFRVYREDPVNLTWTDPNGQTLQGPAQMVDISRSGASIRAHHPVHVGTVLSFGFDDQDFAGKVTHCVSDPSGYLLGVEFEPGYRWMPRVPSIS